MCEYIILDDYIMEKYIYNEQNGLWYELQGGLLTNRRRAAHRYMGTAALGLSEAVPKGFIH